MTISTDRLGWVALAVGGTLGLASCLLATQKAAASAAQDWPPFVLVTGLLLIGLVAGADGLFEACAAVFARRSHSARSLLVTAAVLVSVTTAVLNLDTSVVFLTPVLVLAARRRRYGEVPFAYLAVFLANGASLLLPGSNLTNLIVVGRSNIDGGAFAARMLLPWVASVTVITVVVAVVCRKDLGATPVESDPRGPTARVGTGLFAVAVAVVAVLALPPSLAALIVLATGVLAAGEHLVRSRVSMGSVLRSVNVPILAGLFGAAVAAGTIAREWSSVGGLVVHASSLESAAIGAGSSVVVNNLPAASLLTARPPANPYALLIGLNLGPNLAVTGALSAALWMQVSRSVGFAPSATRFSAIGLILAPLSIAAALGALALIS